MQSERLLEAPEHVLLMQSSINSCVQCSQAVANHEFELKEYCAGARAVYQHSLRCDGLVGRSRARDPDGVKAVPLGVVGAP